MESRYVDCLTDFWSTYLALYCIVYMFSDVRPVPAPGVGLQAGGGQEDGQVQGDPPAATHSSLQVWWTSHCFPIEEGRQFNSLEYIQYTL